jgi:hypothetical protein
MCVEKSNYFISYVHYAFIEYEHCAATNDLCLDTWIV